MLGRRIITGIGALLISLTGTALAEPPHVQARILANVSAVTAGKPFLLGVELKIDPGWHVYWKNSGDAGLPTKVKFTLPAGFTVGDLRFPTPRRIEQPGNIVTFGYEDSVMVMAEVTPPDQLPADFSGEFAAAASWLVCREECIQGKQTLSLTLGSAAEFSPSEDATLFGHWQSQVPADWDTTRDIGRVTSSINGSDGSLTIGWTHGVPKMVQFFPGPNDDYNFTNISVKNADNSSQITFKVEPLAGRKPPPSKLEVVVGYELAENNGAGPAQVRGASVLISLPGFGSN